MKIAVIGLGYVGYPLAQELSRFFDVVGYDINSRRIAELEKSEANTVQKLASTPEVLSDEEIEVVIVAVPTDVDQQNQPDLRPLEGVAQTVSRWVAYGRLIVLESTVWPGFTNETFGAWLKTAGREDLRLGYSPERIVPGSPSGGDFHGAGRHLGNTVKVVSANSAADSRVLEDIYRCVAGGVYVAPTIEIAEGAKIVENIQRDVNIAIMNDLAPVFNAMKIPMAEVVAAAATKWNFHPYSPGLVGGHCIGVDPYYMIKRALDFGVPLQLVRTAREVNSGMGMHVAVEVAQHVAPGSRILLVGWTFKENCDDTRNTRSQDVLNTLTAFGYRVEVAEHHPSISVPNRAQWDEPYDALVLAVAHKAFITLMRDPAWLATHLRPDGLIADVRRALPDAPVSGHRQFIHASSDRYLGYRYWSL